MAALRRCPPNLASSTGDGGHFDVGNGQLIGEGGWIAWRFARAPHPVNRYGLVVGRVRLGDSHMNRGFVPGVVVDHQRCRLPRIG
jgi:hypothetical protein